MLLTFIMPFIKAEWRIIIIIILIGGLYHIIYNRGYNNCEREVRNAQAEAILKTKAEDDKKIQDIVNENTKERIYSQSVEEKLNVEIKKKQYNCRIPVGGVRQLNKLAR